MAIDVPVSRKRGAGALITSKLALGCIHTHTAVHPVRLSEEQERAGPQFEGVLASVDVRFEFSG